jgi:flagellin-like protein
MNRKGLSPVVASIILIAVTVAVSIAVAAWLGALTFNFTNKPNEQVSPVSVNVEFSRTGTFHFLQASITNQQSDYIVPENILVDDATITPVMVLNHLLPQQTYSTTANINWTYDTTYQVTFIWSTSDNHDHNVTASFDSPFAPRILNFTIPPFQGTRYAVWTVTDQQIGYYRTSTLTQLPANITINLTGISRTPDDSDVFNITIDYYNMTNSQLFQFIGEKSYIAIPQTIEGS